MKLIFWTYEWNGWNERQLIKLIEIHGFDFEDKIIETWDGTTIETTTETIYVIILFGYKSDDGKFYLDGTMKLDYYKVKMCSLNELKEMAKGYIMEKLVVI